MFCVGFVLCVGLCCVTVCAVCMTVSVIEWVCDCLCIFLSVCLFRWQVFGWILFAPSLLRHSSHKQKASCIESQFFSSSIPPSHPSSAVPRRRTRIPPSPSFPLPTVFPSKTITISFSPTHLISCSTSELRSKISGAEQPRLGTEVLGHSFARSLAPLTHSLAPLTH